MKNFNDVAGSIAEDAVQYAMQNGIELDYTRESAQNVDAFLGDYYDNLDKYDGDEGAKILWNIAVLFGTYIGEMLLRSGLAEKGFIWVEDNGLPILGVPGHQTAVSPITKAHKRILNGAEDSIKSFVDVTFSIVNGGWPKTGVLRVPDVETASGKKIERIISKSRITTYLLLRREKRILLFSNLTMDFFSFMELEINSFVRPGSIWVDAGRMH